MKTQDVKETTQNNQQTDPPEYTPEPSYTEAPYDNNKKDYTYSIGLPDHEIIVTEREYISGSHIMYNLKGGFSSFNGDTMIFYDTEGKEQFSCGEKGRTIILHEKKNPILNVYIDEFSKKKMYIHRGTKKDEIYACIELNSSKYDALQTYHITVFNKASNMREELDMIYNKFNKYFGIFCNKGKDNEIMIGIIKKLHLLKTNMKFIVEIAPMVDTAFILSLASLIVKLERMYIK